MTHDYEPTAWESVPIGAEILIVSKNGPTQIEAIVLDRTKRTHQLYFPPLGTNMRLNLLDQAEWYPHVKN